MRSESFIPCLPSSKTSPDKDREYWRFLFAGLAMEGRLAHSIAGSAYQGGPTLEEESVKNADSLLAALEAPPKP